MFYVHPIELLKIFLWEGTWVLLYFNLCADCLIWINQTFVMMSYSFSKIVNGRQVLISSDFQVAPCGACSCGPFEFFSVRSVKLCQLRCLTRLSFKKKKKTSEIAVFCLQNWYVEFICVWFCLQFGMYRSWWWRSNLAWKRHFFCSIL